MPPVPEWVVEAARELAKGVSAGSIVALGAKYQKQAPFLTCGDCHCPDIPVCPSCSCVCPACPAIQVPVLPTTATGSSECPGKDFEASENSTVICRPTEQVIYGGGAAAAAIFIGGVFAGRLGRPTKKKKKRSKDLSDDESDGEENARRMDKRLAAARLRARGIY